MQAHKAVARVIAVNSALVQLPFTYSNTYQLQGFFFSRRPVYCSQIHLYICTASYLKEVIITSQKNIDSKVACRLAWYCITGQNLSSTEDIYFYTTDLLFILCEVTKLVILAWTFRITFSENDYRFVQYKIFSERLQRS